MGIRGLSTFIASQKDLFESHDISNSTIVIDGLNLANNLARNAKLDNKTSGDYDSYYHILNEFFTALKNLNIRCILVIDGSTSDSRFCTIQKRMRKRIKESTSDVLHNSKPLLINRVFINYAKSNGIQLHQSIYDSDYDCALLANLYQCPVLTDDSDFFMYNIKHGCFSLCKTTRFKQHVSLFKLDKFLHKFEFKSIELVVIFGVIMDNLNLFASFVNYLSLNMTPTPHSERNLINCLNKFSSTEEFYQFLQDLAIKNKQKLNLNQIKRVIEDGLNEYLLNKTLDDINNNSTLNIDTNLLRDYRLCAKERCWLDILVHKRLILPCLIEKKEWPSVYMSSTNIRKYFYTQVLSKYQPNQANPIVCEYLRAKNQFKEFKIQLISNEEHNFLKKFINQSSLNTLFAIINYWIDYAPIVHQELTTFKQKNHYKIVRALIISLIKCSIMDPLLNTNILTNEIKLDLTSIDLQKANVELNRLINSQKLKYNRDLLHCLGEFQAIYFSFCLLGELDDMNICLNLSPERIYNGTLLLACLENSNLIDNMFRNPILNAIQPIFDKLLGQYSSIFNLDVRTKSLKDHKSTPSPLNSHSNIKKHSNKSN